MHRQLPPAKGLAWIFGPSVADLKAVQYFYRSGWYQVQITRFEYIESRHHSWHEATGKTVTLPGGIFYNAVWERSAEDKQRSWG